VLVKRIGVKSTFLSFTSRFLCVREHHKIAGILMFGGLEVLEIIFVPDRDHNDLGLRSVFQKVFYRSEPIFRVEPTVKVNDQ
jgi:hypothetical protein